MTIAYQLYSSRNWPLHETFGMLVESGIGHVEGYGGLFTDEDADAMLADLLAEHGLTMPSAHFALDQIETAPDRVVRQAQRLGVAAIYCPSLPPDARPADPAGWVAMGARLQVAGAPLREAGLRFGWHNHDFEFAPLPDGSMPLDRLFEGGAALSWEADLAWIARAGVDPAPWISRHGARIAAVHVKDIAPAGENVAEDGWADVGHGVLDWPALLSRLGAETEAAWLVLEHDNPADHVRFARRSHAFLRSRA